LLKKILKKSEVFILSVSALVAVAFLLYCGNFLLASVVNTSVNIVSCNTNSDCGIDEFVDNLFCQNNNVYQNYKTYTCNNPGTIISSCSDSTAPRLQTTCTSGQTCSNGSCVNNIGGDGGLITPYAGITISGRAYPLSKVGVLKDGQLAITTIAGPDSNFTVSLIGLYAGNYNFSIFSEDNKGKRSTLFTFSSFITPGATLKIGGIFIAPTISVDKIEVKRGDNIAIFGQSASDADVIIAVNSEKEFFEKTKADKNGFYIYNFDTSFLEMGQHKAKSKSVFDGEISSFSNIANFIVGNKNIAVLEETQKIKGDLNYDKRVNLVDFSIAAYWYSQQLSSSFKIIEIDALNGDGKINLVDFSIIAYYWTG
jgi:hypothetical protein